MEDFVYEKEEEVGELLKSLFDRWQDEWMYEDLNDYLKAIQKIEPRAFEMLEYPFGVKIKIDDRRQIIIAIKED